MAGKVLFAQVLHSHQPVGNFDSVFEMACEKAYAPYVAELLESGRMPVSLHLSGPLLEWLDEHRHPLLDALRRAAAELGIEFVGGGWYEPILTMLSERDALGQLRGGADLVRRLFGAAPHGAWLTERVWEQNLARLLTDAGYDYTVLDDSHFIHAGFDPDRLDALYWAESDGRLLTVFPASERLRYLIPFGLVEEVIAELRRHRPEEGERLVVYADDGEKFGLWPGTHKHVYEEGWLARYHAALAAESDWLEPVTLSTAFARMKPAAHAYLGDDSYREMTEWALPAASQAEFLRLGRELAGDGRFQRLKRFFRGGSWRAFKAKYPELRRLYARMIAVSATIDRLPAVRAAAARRELYRAQCNCAWWHGVFGGLYMPHLRGAVWRHLLAAERLADAAARRKRPALERADFDLDGRTELRLRGGGLSALVAPARGGHVFELDLTAADEQLTDVLSRRFEAYHDEIRERLARGTGGGPTGGSVSIHDLQRQATAEHGSHLVYDDEPLESLVDHLEPGSWAVEDLWRGGLSGDAGFRRGEYLITAGGGAEAAVRLVRQAPLAGHGPLELVKDLALGRDGLQAGYRLINRGAEPLEFTFGVELNLCRDFEAPRGGEARGPEVRFHPRAARLLLACPPRGLRAGLRAPGAAAASWQVKTVSQSETGYEVCVQGLAVMVWWYLRLPPGAAAEKTLTLSVERV
jgi:alpha-amylase